MLQRWRCIWGFLLCRSTQFSKEDNWLCSTISPSRWYTGQLWQSRTSSPAALPPPNLPDLNLLLPSREESWRVDTFKFHILRAVINSLCGRARIQNCMRQSEMMLMLQSFATMRHIRWSVDSFTINSIDNASEASPPSISMTATNRIISLLFF